MGKVFRPPRDFPCHEVEPHGVSEVLEDREQRYDELRCQPRMLTQTQRLTEPGGDEMLEPGQENGSSVVRLG